MKTFAPVAAFFILIAQVACAGTVISNFEDGIQQDWTTAGDVAGVSNPGSGGNPGGYLKMVDQAVGDVCWVIAPASYLGDWQNKASISADLTQISFSGNEFMTVEFRISGPGGSYKKVFGERPPLGLWRTYGTVIDESTWTKISGEWSELLKNVTEFRISLEFITGDETNGMDNVCLTDDCTLTTIGLAKQMPDGSCVSVDGVVSRVMQDCMYIQSEDRSAGIRVKNSFVLSPGDRVRVSGTLATEHLTRILEHAVVLSKQAGTPPKPLLIIGRELGGIGATVADPVLGNSQTLKETGLLVRTCGRVAEVGADGTFLLTDGSGGIRVKLDDALAMPPANSHIIVTGLSACDEASPANPIILVKDDDWQYARVPLDVNIVRNGGAEEGIGGSVEALRPIAGWQTNSLYFAVTNYGSKMPVAQSEVIGGGARHFFGGLNGSVGEVWQDIDISLLSDLISNGELSATLSGYLAGYATQGDNITVSVTFLDTSGQNFGTMQIGPQAGSNETYIYSTTTADVPPGTKQAQVRIISKRAAGTENSGYADNISLVLSRKTTNKQ